MWEFGGVVGKLGCSSSPSCSGLGFLLELGPAVNIGLADPMLSDGQFSKPIRLLIPPDALDS